ncbi:MAG TPA: DUF1574 domain-containing protein [Oscillatoriales cyanobacterium M59_W2019_021]|nr:DUF1574 domain-containing protein [Oscillatoriales cyanobacterium M59_W2019_021]
MLLNADRQVPVGSQLSITQWAYQALGIPGIELKVRVRETQLHISCEGRQCPDATVVMARFSQAIHQDFPLPDQLKTIERVYLYGRHRDDAEDGENLDWTVRLEVNPSELHKQERLSSLQRPLRLPTSPPPTPLTNPEDPREIARQLEAIVGHLGIRVKVSFKDLEDSQSLNQQYRRLWVLCEATYTPDPALLGQPIAQRLRELQLRGFRDAAILGHVRGEARPEWMLRVDLTPIDRILDTWSHWGDVGAIAEQLNRALADRQLQVSAALKEYTLHVFCTPQPGVFARRDVGETFPFPDRESVAEVVAPILERLSPRGIVGAIVYGIDRPYEAAFGEPTSPRWVNWLNLPASGNSKLAKSTLSLAQDGHLGALAFLLERLLNPDLNQKLLTGGIRVQIRRKADLLHVMTEALVCPQQTQVVESVSKFLRQLSLTDILGVRVYGRRSGQKQPRWSYGVDFKPRTASNREMMPEFAATETDMGDLLPSPEWTVLDIRPATTAPQPGWQVFATQLHDRLQSTQLFIDRSPEKAPSWVPHHRLATALVWGISGLLLVGIADLVLSSALDSWKPAASTNTPTTALSVPDDPEIEPISPSTAADEGVFDSSGFTTTPPPASASASAAAPAGDYSFPTFNSQQFDNQLALYNQYLKTVGVPDVLVVGSSRSLRGIDPATLETALAREGYPNVRVFNFGINGATAQVVNLLLKQVLTPKQLPKLIIWADGARAFNSGRDDRTYEAITLSEGYKQTLNGAKPIQFPEETVETPVDKSFFQLVRDRYQNIDDALNQGLSQYSATYPQRETLRSAIFSAISALGKPSTPDEPGNSQEVPSDPTEVYHANGFLDLSVRFDPKTYYQQYSKVTGSYDGDYQSFQLRGKQATALYSLVELAQTYDIDLVFVNLPLTAEYLDAVRMKHERDFQQSMLRSSKELGFIFRDLSQLWPTQHSYFSDPSHLNRYGAAAVSEKLARDPMIPWSAGSADSINNP